MFYGIELLPCCSFFNDEFHLQNIPSQSDLQKLYSPEHVISYKFYGFTKSGQPLFPTFLKVNNLLKVVVHHYFPRVMMLHGKIFHPIHYEAHILLLHMFAVVVVKRKFLEIS